LEGLEISEVYYSYVKKSNLIFRYDSNFFLKEFIKNENLIRNKKHSTLKEIGVSLLSFGAYSLNNDVEYVDSGVPFIRGINMKKGRIDFSNIIYISEKANALLWKSEVKPETVLLSMSGTIGDVAIASKKWNYPINSNQDIAKIHTDNKINPYYLFSFLLSKYGQNYLRREARGSVQQHVFLSQMEMFEIPLFKNEFIIKIQKIVELSERLLANSQQSYTQAETLLLETLGLKDFKPSNDPVNIKSFKESFAASGRLDAEYYQLKYEDYLKLIRSYSKGFKPLDEICHIKDNNFNPSEKIEYKYIELANIGKSGEVTGCTIDYGSELPSRARRRVNTNDVIISSIEGSLGSCALINKEFDNALCSTGFYILTSSTLNPESLLVLFKSEPMQNILKKGCSGTILTAIGKPELLKIPIPIIESTIQKSIQELVKESSVLRLKSEQLLELAKTAVEKAIEENEELALQYIEKSLLLMDEKSI